MSDAGGRFLFWCASLRQPHGTSAASASRAVCSAQSAALIVLWEFTNEWILAQ
jgi:hypothetical protein